MRGGSATSSTACSAEITSSWTSRTSRPGSGLRKPSPRRSPAARSSWSSSVRDGRRSCAQRAQEQQRDYVREEIEAALTREVTIVPVLVGGATIGQLLGPPGETGRACRNTKPRSCGTAVSARTAHASPTGCGSRRRTIRQAFTEKGVADRRRRPRSCWFWAGSQSGHGANTARASRRSPKASRRPARSPIAANTNRRSKRTRAFCKIDPRNHAATDGAGGCGHAMAGEFPRPSARRGKGPRRSPARPLDQIIAVLDAALAKTNGQGPRAADILAHLGWAHWLNQKTGVARIRSRRGKGFARGSPARPLERLRQCDAGKLDDADRRQHGRGAPAFPHRGRPE